MKLPSTGPGSPRVSVIVTTYNRKAVLPEAIDSALAQTFRDIEIIVVDDGSTDGTEEEVRRRYGHDPRVRIIRRANGGCAAARNIGINAARGEWIALLDSDDWWEPGYLASQLTVLAAHPEADLVVCNGRRQDQDGSWHNLFDHPYFVLPTSIEAMCAGAWTQASFTVVRTTVARELRFGETVQIVDDQEFMWRFLEAGYRCVGNPESLAEYRAVRVRGLDTEKQLTADYERMRLDAYALCKRHSATYPAVLRRGLAFDQEFGELLFRHGRLTEARFHLWRWWRVRPHHLRAGWMLLRSVLAR